MTLSMFNASIAPLKHHLNALTGCLRKGLEFAHERKIEPSILLNARLFPDMFPLVKQVQIATDMAKGGAGRLASVEIPKYEDNESSFEELFTRLQNTITFLDSLPEEAFEMSADKAIELKLKDRTLHFVGQEYLLYWVIPNVLFHVTTAYNILRHNGVPLGKADFLSAK